jgi:hypothetical protein
MSPLFLCTALALSGGSEFSAPLVVEDSTPRASLDWLAAPLIRLEEPLPVPGPVDPEALPSESDTAKHYAPNLYRRFEFSAGVAAYDKFSTNLQVSGDAGAGASLDLEDFLGISSSDTIARFDAHYSFNRRHRIDASYYDIRRSGTKGTDEDITVGDVVIPAGSVDSKFDTQILKLAYRYNFVADERTVIGASFGVHVMGIDFGIQNDSFSVEEQFKVAAPLPLIGLHAGYALSDKWSLLGSVEFLQFDIDEYRGFISDTRLTIQHDTFEWLGWGVGFNGFRVDGSIEGEQDLKADLEYGYQGLMLYLRFYL